MAARLPALTGSVANVLVVVAVGSLGHLALLDIVVGPASNSCGWTTYIIKILWGMSAWLFLGKLGDV